MKDIFLIIILTIIITLAILMAFIAGFLFSKEVRKNDSDKRKEENSSAQLQEKQE